MSEAPREAPPPGAASRIPLSRSRRLLFVLLTLSVFLAAAELAAGWLEPSLIPPQRVLPPPAPGAHPDFEQQAARSREGLPLPHAAVGGWRAPSDGGLYRNHSLGLRGPELPPRREGQLRLLTLGDSSIWGWGVGEEEVFSAVCGRLLEAEGHGEVLAINGGIPGHELAQTLATLRDLGERLDPDWVLIGNQWSDIFLDQGRRRQDWVDRLDFDGRFALYRVTRRLLQPWLRARKIAYLRGDEDLSDPSEQHLRRFQQQLDELIAEAQGLGAQAALILLPAPADLDPAPLPETILEYRAVLRDAAQRHQLPLLDGPAWFRDRGAVLGHFLDQVHPSAQGHALLGEACASLLRGER